PHGPSGALSTLRRLRIRLLRSPKARETPLLWPILHTGQEDKLAPWESCSAPSAPQLSFSASAPHHFQLWVVFAPIKGTRPSSQAMATAQLSRNRIASWAICPLTAISTQRVSTSARFLTCASPSPTPQEKATRAISNPAPDFASC